MVQRFDNEKDDDFRSRSVIRALRFRSALYTVLLGLLVIVAVANAAAQKTAPPQPIDLNSATIAQLQQLPSVGGNTAKSIVAFRERSGPFHRVEDLLAIKGISKSKLEKLRPYVTVVPATEHK
jgi:competence ComEA-like helix-hairpin-helix protein